MGWWRSSSASSLSSSSSPPGVGRTPTVEKVTATGDAVQDADPSACDQDGRRYPPAGAGTLKQARASKPRRTRESHRFVTYSRYMVFKVRSPATVVAGFFREVP